ncbi:MAG: phosphodiester glycosidase family protein [Treponemataceae bacterium]|nr:phosphodiester glycosidase family protein [Treponemataceae bacterium]
MIFQKKARLYSFLAIAFSCAAFGCKSANFVQESEHDFSSVRLEWNSTSEKQNVFTAEYCEERLLIHCVKIKLNAPEIKIKMLPQIAQEKSAFVKEFARKNNLDVAFNTTPFSAKGIFKNRGQTPLGICINDGKEISAPISRYCALAFFQSEGNGFRAKIFASQADAELKGASFAAGGYWQILRDGEIILFKKFHDTRAFCALDAEGTTLFLFAVEGLSYMECAEFIKAIGLENAMQFDGGASTQIIVGGNSILTYKNKVKVPAMLGFSF